MGDLIISLEMTWLGYMGKWLTLIFFSLFLTISALKADVYQDAQVLAERHNGEVFQVSGESMLKFFRPGSLIVSIPVDFSKVKFGQVIVYRNNSGKLVVHRIVGKSNGELVARGSENGFDDISGVNQKNCVGVVYAIFNSWGDKKEKTPAKEVFALENVE